ncbi:MAG: hypothetical protein KDA90_22030 [Planctomycetaceae bacterium]|nr:hypothetical protein [Planctomycetaceae bacterium]
MAAWFADELQITLDLNGWESGDDFDAHQLDIERASRFWGIEFSQFYTAPPKFNELWIVLREVDVLQFEGIDRSDSESVSHIVNTAADWEDSRTGDGAFDYFELQSMVCRSLVMNQVAEFDCLLRIGVQPSRLGSQLVSLLPICLLASFIVAIVVQGALEWIVGIYVVAVSLVLVSALCKSHAYEVVLTRHQRHHNQRRRAVAACRMWVAMCLAACDKMADRS